MSQENVEAVRQIFDSFPTLQARLRRGDLAVGEPFAEDIEWDASEIRLPDAGSGHYRGRDGVRRFWVDWLTAWANVNFEYELRDGGDRVVALINQSMLGSEGVEIPFGRYAQIFTFKHSQIVHWKAYRHQNEALEAVGLQ